MNCEVAQERIVAAAYAELPDAEVHELNTHLKGCPECAQERAQVEALKTLCGTLPVLEPSANLIARSRLRLDEAIDTLPPRGWFERFGQSLRLSAARLQSAPLAAGLLLAAGAAAGGLGGFQLANASKSNSVAPAPLLASVQPSTAAQFNTIAAPAVTAAPSVRSKAETQVEGPAQVAEISQIVRQPGSNLVEVRFSSLVPQSIKGSLNDPAIRQLLMMASEEAPNQNVRTSSVDLMAAACQSDRNCNQEGMLEALMVALRYDQNPAIRARALEGLQPYVAEDVRVRNAVLETLLNDSDVQVRAVSINVLEPVEADTSVRQVLYSISNSDANPQIRNVSRQVLSRAPEVQ